MIGTVGVQIGQFIQRRRAEAERARLLARVQRAHAEARSAERRAAFLAEASRLLSASLDFPPDLDPLACLAATRLADWCTVDILMADGTLRRVGAAHAVAEKTALVRNLLDRYPHRAFRAAVSAGRAALVGVVADDDLLGAAGDSARAALVRELEIRSFMLVPLVARGHAVGALAFASATPGRFEAADLALAEDLAYRIALAIDNARLYQEAHEAGRRKDEFLAMLGHELRNPLAAIDASVAVLDRVSSQAGAAVHQREIIHRQTRHLVRLVDDLLDVSRVVSGKIALQRETVDLNDLAARCVESLARRFEERGHVTTFTRADGPVVTQGDAVRLEQVLINLLDNAIKYTPTGGHIDVSVERVGAEGVLRVRDNGVGMTKELVPHVFDLFAQAERSLDRAEGGLGLGLTLVRRLVEQHGGTVAASSAGPGRGSEFIVSVPVDPDLVAVPVPADTAVAPVPHLRIVLVEDNADARDALRTLLEVSGHRVEIAGDGPSGIELARRVRPDVTLIDIGLTGADGYEVARRLRADGGDGLRLVALTGYGQPEDRRRALDAGFDAHLVKPVEAEDLNRVLAGVTAADAA
ncbi:MAG TPA: ATP-binding protein [Candidatus Binatia bacterium]|nr:ATP-binding protein [Candidatus Binatia bacterium]